MILAPIAKDKLAHGEQIRRESRRRTAENRQRDRTTANRWPAETLPTSAIHQHTRVGSSPPNAERGNRHGVRARRIDLEEVPPGARVRDRGLSGRRLKSNFRYAAGRTLFRSNGRAIAAADDRRRQPRQLRLHRLDRVREALKLARVPCSVCRRQQGVRLTAHYQHTSAAHWHGAAGARSHLVHIILPDLPHCPTAEGYRRHRASKHVGHPTAAAEEQHPLARWRHGLDIGRHTAEHLVEHPLELAHRRHESSPRDLPFHARTPLGQRRLIRRRR